MNRIELSLVVTLYDLTKLEIENWKFIVEECKNIDGLQILFLNDNPKREQEYKESFSGSADYYSENKNFGKYQLVKNAADKGLIKGRWSKFCDPDDLILIEQLKEFVEKVSLLKRTPFIKFEYSRIIHPYDWDVKEQNIIDTISNHRKMRSLVNENSVIPTEDVVNFDLIAYNQTKSSDILFSLSSFWKEEKRDILFISRSFYVYNLHKGISAEKNSIKSKNIRPINELITLLEIFERYNEEHTLFTPSFYDYRWTFNYMSNNGFGVFKRIKMCNKVWNKLKIVSRDNNAWKKKYSFFERIRFVYIKNIFDIRRKKWKN